MLLRYVHFQFNEYSIELVKVDHSREILGKKARLGSKCVYNDKLLHNIQHWPISKLAQQMFTNFLLPNLLTAIVSEKFFSLSLLLRTPPILKNVGFSPLLGFCSSTQLIKANNINVHK
jgi:hypothetical protein